LSIILLQITSQEHCNNLSRFLRALNFDETFELLTFGDRSKKIFLDNHLIYFPIDLSEINAAQEIASFSCEFRNCLLPW